MATTSTTSELRHHARTRGKLLSVSKKALASALEHARRGDMVQALAMLEGVDTAFINKRITHFLGQPDQREVARRLKAELDRTRPQRVRLETSHVPFAAPLSPGVVERAPEAAITFDAAAPFLTWASASWDKIPPLDLDQVAFTDVWPLAGLACLLFPERLRRPPVRLDGSSGAVRFAHAVGLSAIVGGPTSSAYDFGRTVRLTRVMRRTEIEPAAEAMSSLLVSAQENQNVRLALKYVLVELLRNVVQHSGDPLGAVAGAQRMDRAQRRERPMVQLVVADAGMGIPAHLKSRHPHLGDYRQALERALLPHISGTFDEGLTGSVENAGLGLYMISELARQTGGRLLIATHGATLVLQPNKQGGPGTPHFLEPPGTGFPGTLVAFELPTDAVGDYHQLMQQILKKAQERTPKRVTGRWIAFDEAPDEAVKVLVTPAREDTVAAAQVSADAIMPALLQRKPVALDFTGLDLCTQSWLHALLYEPVRLAWALRVPIHATGAEPAVQEGLRFLEAYALGG
jgi:hypothetical protein